MFVFIIYIFSDTVVWVLFVE